MDILPPETLLDIFATVCKISRLSVVAALARTCKAFKEPALDILWQHICGFEPLILCLPEVVVERRKGEKLTLTRPLSLDDWNIIGRYTHRIHSFFATSDKLDVMDDRVVEALISAPAAPLLPKLRSLRWYDQRERFFPLLRALFVPTIGSVLLASNLRVSWAPSLAKSGLLASLGTQCPSIREFSGAYDGDSHAICESVCGWRELCNLNTGVLNTRSLRHLTSLPSLKSLRFVIHDFDDREPYSPVIFPFQLNEIYITAPVPHLFTRPLRNVRFLSCRSVALWLGYSVIEEGRYGRPPQIQSLPFESMVLQNLMAPFSESFSPTLEKITVRIFFPRNADVDHSRVLDFAAVAPLLSFSRLIQLGLFFNGSSTIDDAELKIMAQSWPQLEEFRLETGNEIPDLTFIGLVHLVRHCRRLREITLSFHAYSIDIKCEPFSKTTPNENITRIEIGVSPIFDPDAVACQLHVILPNLTTLSSTCFAEFADPWEKVEQNLRSLHTQK